MKKKKHVISRVLPGSIGEELELEPGDILAEINHQLVEDVFDYRYLMNDEYIELLIEKANGELWELEVEKDYDEDLGIEFENGPVFRRSTMKVPTFSILPMHFRLLKYLKRLDFTGKFNVLTGHFFIENFFRYVV